MIRVGYITNDNQEHSAGEFFGVPDANACMDQLIAETADRTDIQNYFFAKVIGEEVNRYGFIDP